MVKFMSKEWLREFFIPHNFLDVVFILVCFVLAWYALSYDIPTAKVPAICANYWNAWAAEKAAYLDMINATDEVAKYVLNNYTGISRNFTVR